MISMQLIQVSHQSEDEQKIRKLKHVNVPLSLLCEIFISMLGNMLLYHVE